MSQQKDFKVKNRYSKSQQFEPIGAFNYKASAQQDNRGNITETNPFANQIKQKNTRIKRKQQQMTTQSDYENILKTQEGIIDTEISQNALMFSPNTNIMIRIMMTTMMFLIFYIIKYVINSSIYYSNETNKILYQYKEEKDKGQITRDIYEDNSKQQSEKQSAKTPYLGKIDNVPQQMSYEMQNLMRMQVDTTKSQLLNDKANQEHQIQKIQSIKIPLTDFLEQNMPQDNTVSKNEQGLFNTTKSINQQSVGLRSSRMQNETMYQDKVRRIQNMKNKKNENDKKLQKGGSYGFSGSSTPQNDQDMQQQLFQKEILRQQRQSLQGTLVLQKDNVKENQPSIFKQGVRVEKADQNWNMVKKLNIMMRVKQKFFQLIQQRVDNITSFHHYMIADCTDAPNLRGEVNKFHINSLFYKAFLQTLNPGSFIVIYYKVFLTLYTLFNIIYLPLIFGFDLQLDLNFIGINTASIVIYFFEMFTKFRISYYHMGEIVDDRKKIFWRYMNHEFLTDMISIIALIIGYDYKPALLFILLRNRNVVQYLWDIDNHYYLAERFHTIWILLKLFGFIAIMAHYFACVFHYTGMVQEKYYPEFTTWTREFNLLDKPWELRYNYSIYFSFITCITIGYGDITPKNTEERNIVILISLISTGCFSYSVNTMATIFQEYINKSKKSKEMRYDAINYMRERNIHKNLQLRVLKYIEYIYQMEAKSPDKGLSVINQISSQLKTQLFQDYYGKIIRQDKHFSLNYSKETIDKFSLKMKERIYGPGEIIFEQGEQDTRIFFLMKGEIEFIFQNRGNKLSEQLTISHTNKNQFFGYKGFISGIPREMACRSVNVTQVFYCTREDLVQVLKENPIDYEQYCKLKDEYLIQQTSLGEQCFSCMEYGHTIQNCYKIRFVKNKEILILKQNYTSDQQRNFIERTSRKYATFLNLQLTAFEAMKSKLNKVMLLKKQFIPDEILEKIIIDEHDNDKDFSNKYPSIKFAENNEMYLCQIDDQIIYSTSDTDSDLTQISETSSRTSIEHLSLSQEDESSSLSSDHNKNIKNDKKYRKSKYSKQRISISDKNESQDEKDNKLSYPLRPDNYNEFFNANQISTNEQQDSQNSTQKITQIPEYNYSEQVQKNSSLKQNGGLVSELIGIQNMNKPTSPKSNNLQTRDQEISRDLIGNNQVDNKYQNYNKQVSFQELIIQKNEPQNQKAEFLESIKGRVAITNDYEDKKQINNNLGRRKPSGNTSAVNYSQNMLKHVKKIQGKMFTQGDKKNQLNKEDREKNLIIEGSKVANIAQLVQSPQKQKPTRPQSLTPQGQKLQQAPQSQQTSALQILTGPIATPKKPFDQNEMVINFYQGQIQRLNQYLNFFQNQNQKNNKLPNLSNSFVNDHQIPLRQISSIKDDNKPETMININSQKRSHVYNLEDFIQKRRSEFNDQEIDPYSEFFINDFDSLKDYSIYFPHNNHSIVCMNYKRIMRKQQQQQKKNSKQINPSLAINIGSKHGNKFKKIDYDLS